jgi:hypothetical protein
MDKLLSDKNKDNNVSKKDGSASVSLANPFAVPDANALKTTATAYTPELSYKNWEDEQKNLRWDSTPQGRAVIRLFSRGVLGSIGFAIGSSYVNRGEAMKGYSANMKLSEIDQSKPLQYIAKSIDTFVGKPITFIAKSFGKSEAEAAKLVSFRPTTGGRSLGHEAVAITFDFFCASGFDALGRDIANILDSKVKHDWKDENGKIDYKKAFKEAGKSAWRYVSYNGGEDWAVSVPYAFYLRAQRNFIDKRVPGFGVDSDRALNGGSLKVDKNGKVTGNYYLAGMADLQGRFTAYNVGTLMYREVYNHVANKINGYDTVLYGSASEKKGKEQNLVEKISEPFKWVVRSVVKAVIYMTPAVPFFHVFRTPQTSYRAQFINPDTNQHTEISAAIGFDPHKQNVGNPILNAIGKGQNTIRNGFSDFTVKFVPNRQDANTYINSAMSYTPYMYAKGEFARLWDDGRMDAALERAIDGAAKLSFHEFKAGAGEVWRSITKQPFTDEKREAYAIKRIQEDESPADNLTKEQARLDQLHDISQSPLSWRQRIVQGRPSEKDDSIGKPKLSGDYSHAEQEEMRKALAELQPPTNSIH